MRSFIDESGQDWIVTAKEEETPRHHGRWYLVFQPNGGADGQELSLPEVQWQNRATAERTILTMSEVELRRRLRVASDRVPRSVFSNPVPAT